MKVKYSVIVPVYNAEKYLDECLRSLHRQKFKDCEFIIWNDGSSDGSQEIIKKYLKDKRFITFKEPNIGLAGARKKALEHAKGDYILFLDADDIVSKYLLTYIDEYMDPSADLFQYSSTLSYKELEKIDSSSFATPILYNRKEFKEQYIRPVIIDGNVGVVMWDKVFRKDILQRCIVDYPPKMLEDYLTIMNYSENVQLFQIADTVLHYYRVVKNSLSKQQNNDWLSFLLYVQDKKKKYMKKMSLNSINDQRHAAAWFLRYIYNKLINSAYGMDHAQLESIFKNSEIIVEAESLKGSQLDSDFAKKVRNRNNSDIVKWIIGRSRIHLVGKSIKNLVRK